MDNNMSTTDDTPTTHDTPTPDDTPTTDDTDNTKHHILDNELASLKSEIEENVNPKTIQESIYLLSNPEQLISRMQQGADLFKEKTGRNMSYAEMREMYG